MASSVRLRPFRASDLETAHGLSAKLQWPHRLEDWQFALAHGTGIVAEHDGRVVGTALRWRGPICGGWALITQAVG